MCAACTCSVLWPIWSSSAALSLSRAIAGLRLRRRKSDSDICAVFNDTSLNDLYVAVTVACACSGLGVAGPAVGVLAPTGKAPGDPTGVAARSPGWRSPLGFQDRETGEAASRHRRRASCGSSVAGDGRHLQPRAYRGGGGGERFLPVPFGLRRKALLRDQGRGRSRRDQRRIG